MRNFYAVQREGVGISVWKFPSPNERTAWVEKKTTRAAVVARDARRLLERPSPGLYVRPGN